MATSTSTLRTLSESQLTVENPDEDVRGRKVFDATGKEIGTVEDLIVDDAESKVRFLRVARGGFLGIGEKRYIVPVDAIATVTDDAVHIDRSHEHAAAAPDYDPDLAAADHHQYWGDVYDYWGYVPFWSAGYSYPAFPLYAPNSEEHWQEVDKKRWDSD